MTEMMFRWAAVRVCDDCLVCLKIFSLSRPTLLLGGLWVKRNLLKWNVGCLAVENKFINDGKNISVAA